MDVSSVVLKLIKYSSSDNTKMMKPIVVDPDIYYKYFISQDLSIDKSIFNFTIKSLLTTFGEYVGMFICNTCFIKYAKLGKITEKNQTHNCLICGARFDGCQRFYIPYDIIETTAINQHTMINQHMSNTLR